MGRHFVTTALGLLLGMTAAAQRPTPEQQQRTLEAAREAALHYSARLPDFICTEQVERTDATGPNNIKVDRLTLNLSYNDQKERYKLVARNGSPSGQRLDSLDGLITGGEFGSLLRGIFDPASAADFQWKSSATLRKHPAVVYTYRIARAKSRYVIGHRTQGGGMITSAAGYSGEVFFDPETSRVLRLTATADDIPKDSGILASATEVDYDFIDISGNQYLLPSRSNSSMQRTYRRISNTVTFTDYRKFEAESTIDFKP